MPRGCANRKKHAYSCPNASWKGCSHPDPYWLKKSFEKHVILCNATKQIDQDAEKSWTKETMMEVIRGIRKDMNDMKVAHELQLKVSDDRFLILEKRLSKGRYNMRRGRPRYNMQEWTSDMFLNAVPDTVAWFRKRTDQDLRQYHALEIMANVLYFMNDKQKIITIPKGTPKDRNGMPLRCNINYCHRVWYDMPIDTASKYIFKSQFMPSEEDMTMVLKMKMPTCSKWNYYENYLCHKSEPSKQDTI